MTLTKAYSILEIDVGAPESEVRSARNILLRVWHPDRHQRDATLSETAAKKTSLINVAFALIEKAGFPSPDELSELGPKPTVDQVLKARELELRAREVRVAERLAERPTATDWIDAKAKMLFRTVLILGCIGGLVVLAGFALLVLSNDKNTSDQQTVCGGAIIGGMILVAILRAALNMKRA